VHQVGNQYIFIWTRILLTDDPAHEMYQYSLRMAP